jgi:hypothetical protein
MNSLSPTGDAPMDDLHLNDSKPPKLSLPEGWPSIAIDAILHVIAVARIAMIHARDWPSDVD